MRLPPRLVAAAIVTVLGVATGLAVRADGPPPSPGAAADDPLVVHEWGTFTSVQGADGVSLEGLQHEEEALPSFVYDRCQVRDCPLRKAGWKGLEVPVHHVTQKMETPVLYFHTKTPRTVRVRVDFVQGLISQWYPVVDRLGPPEGARDAGPLDLRTVARSFVEWDVDLVPRSAPRPAEVPPSGPGTETWDRARAVDAAWVRTRPRQGPERAGPVEAEHFLFYRGLGTFSVPMTVSIGDDDALALRNGSAHEVAQVVAVEVTDGGRRGRWDVVCGVAPGATAADLLAGRELVDWRTGVEALGGDVEKILRGQGMDADEAHAMVATWRRSWFEAEGLRVLYVVPRPLVDAILPLSIEPAPAAVRRVLLGRIECLPPKRVAELADLLGELGGAAGPDAPDAEKTLALFERARGIGGRFLEPYLRRVVATTTDAAARRVAQGWLDKLTMEAAALAATTR